MTIGDLEKILVHLQARLSARLVRGAFVVTMHRGDSMREYRGNTLTEALSRAIGDAYEPVSGVNP